MATPNIQCTSGYKSEEVNGRNILEFVHPGDSEVCVENFRKILSGETISVEYRFITKDGRTIWLHCIVVNAELI